MNKVKTVVFGVMMSVVTVANAINEAITVTGEVERGVKLSPEFDPTTGYGWMIKDLLGGLIFVSGGCEQLKDCPKGAVGCGGEGVLRLTGEKKGEDILKLTYGRSSGKSSWQEKEAKVMTK